MKWIFGWAMIITLVTMAIVEVGRYRRAQRAQDDFPYPRRRLSRRIAVSLIFSAIMALLMYWPHGAHPGVQMAMLGIFPIGILIGFLLLWRDLRETSQAAVDHAAVLSRQTGEAFKMILEHKGEGENPPAPAKPSDPPQQQNS